MEFLFSEIGFYSILSVIVVSLVSLVGLATLSLSEARIKSMVIFFVSFSAGALLGDVFFHIFPEIAVEGGIGFSFSALVLSGILFSFILEKFIRWRHCHIPESSTHKHHLASMNLVGDAVHNFIDGIIIAASYLVSFPVGFATTVAVVLHEIPQEIGDFGVLIHSGFSRQKAIAYNFLIALTAVFGAVLALLLSSFAENLSLYFMPFAAGMFIYIAGSDLIPELHRDEFNFKSSALQLIFLVLGFAVMAALLFLE